MIQHGKIQKTQTRRKGISWRILLLFFLEIYFESQNSHQLFTDISYLSPLVYLELATENFNCTIFGIWQQKLTTNKSKSKKLWRQRCRSPSNHMLWKQKLFSVSKVVKLFSVRLLNNVTIYKINKNNSKNGQLCTKIRKFCMETRSNKSKKTFCKNNRPQN